MKNYCLAFEYWLGRNLNDSERPIIAALERARQRQLPVRLIVRDGPWFDSKPILIRYIRWYMLKINEWADVCIVAPTVGRAKVWGSLLPRRPVITANARFSSAAHGNSFDIALIFDTDEYPWCAKWVRDYKNPYERFRRVDVMQDIIRNVTFGMPLAPGKIVILHTTGYVPAEFRKTGYLFPLEYLPAPNEIDSRCRYENFLCFIQTCITNRTRREAPSEQWRQLEEFRIPNSKFE